jgi:S1-C subfamily serine protease
VKCEFRIISGGRAGQRQVFDRLYIGIGRHPTSDLRLDPEQDLDASTRHAAVLRTGDRWVLRDLGSRNGTFVNGTRIDTDHTLADGDVMRFGINGPEVQFHLVRDGSEQVIEAVHRAPDTAPAATSRPPGPSGAASARRAPPAPGSARQAATPRSGGGSTTTILRAQVSAQATRVRALGIVLAILAVGAVAVVLWQGRTAHRQVAALGTQIDSLSKEVEALRIAQAAADSQAAALRAQLRSERNPARRAALQRRFTAVESRQRAIAEAQTVDWAAINRSNGQAVAMLWVRFASDTTRVWTGTGFGVAPQGLLLTNRHVVISERGERALEIAVQFSGSAEVLRARLERVAPDVDIATVRITDRGTYPAVRSLNPDLASAEVGDPIALIGFPLGLDSPMGGTAEHPLVRATLAPGTIGKVLPDSLLQLDAYSGTGASGSPIFDRDGKVIGVEFGGLRESEGRIVLGLPIRRAMALLASSSSSPPE